MSARASGCLSPRTVIGVFIIVLGVAFTLDNFGFPVGATLREALANGWPVVFVLAGVARLIESPDASREPNAYVWILVGGVLLAHNFGYLDFDKLWPLGLVLGGAFLVWRAFVPPGAPRSESGSRIDALAIMGGTRRTSSAPDFRGGNLMAFMGGVELDLRDARMASGKAALEAFTVWGGIEITVPRDWAVTSRGIALLGGFEDKTRLSGDAGTVRPTLVISGLALMGGVEIKN